MVKAANDPDQHIYYDEGVGSHGWDSVLGGAIGLGLSYNVREAYCHLSQHYQDDVEIYIFGFSRGAYTARSLAGFIAASGLLRPANCNDENVARAWDNYRKHKDERDQQEINSLKELSYPNVRIKCLGVFDTVGALGIPIGYAGANVFANLVKFHDTKLGASIDYAFQALALDEHRGPFVATLWAKPDHDKNKGVEQVWFPGVHTDVGGGYEKNSAESQGAALQLSDITLDWMIGRVRKLGLKATYSGIDHQKPVGSLHDSLGWYVASRARPMVRLVDATPIESDGWLGARTYALEPPDQSINECVHISALKLWARPVSIDGEDSEYRPKILQPCSIGFAAVRSRRWDTMASSYRCPKSRRC